MLIIGHRGAAGLAKENTIGSFQKAVELGVDMVETDLRRDKAGQIVLSHNNSSKLNLTTLAEALGVITVPVNLELKQAGLEREVLSAIKNFSSSVLISSKYPKILQKIRALDESVQLGLVIGKANWFLIPFIPKLDKVLKLYSIHPKTFLAKKLLIQRFRRLGKKVFVWTVNNPTQFQKLKALGIDGVFTDYPNIIKNYD
ncbi:MAG: hypothetical protein A3J07_03650 [Candidatus Doudnabacteria bacterium RIFCSPLOWO2_02_FULL_49_13]|uniref:GP-PDE domain-containing protein n=1 Tax=Candidatus Doudnabacteria bacterium RIFCSPHIGHO2_12_FULL_48_16 TaxID=1817838 RepID=A0A1F5PJ96_9BACT|nr:MAG: hypothetical protein A3B77_02460 [Candidatus Doudnabacteria bacterium RIFCSPHIGHO2_02_FULL_49_24]OGE88142.1 MAG: hypothetical protein A2760_02850 [Candidatus Doudnabacteria bacterium RIFCSPHIGHO2_01_FULL_50_67]OGE90013.1 MAG: hypothetical protein A3E29_02795 [Candidatus Doudnabacteria bacterium RIFCSPHIGHO2_12_FULL_48_16]OGE96586.1 MAG: hypothetical protein A2990_00105 [Candidatus Doudnabacteria bacterium RIFCSPLOWO2_01_FULL_49_40]OGF03156.1 MAG: hypothetical protein A3J07_03650 [Candid